MKTSGYKIVAAAAGILLPLLAGCDSMLDTSLNMSPIPGVNIGVGVSTPISGYWDDDNYFPWWSGGIAGPPAWGIGGPGWTNGWNRPPRPPMRPGIPANRPVRPVVPPAGTIRPYPTGPGPVVGGSGLPVLRPGAVTRPPVTTPPNTGGGSYRRGANL